jgi:hypothetical protein
MAEVVIRRHNNCTYWHLSCAAMIDIEPLKLLTLRPTLTKTVMTAMVSIVLTGCGKLTSPGIPEALNSETLLQEAGRSQGIKLGPLNSSSGGGTHSADIERRIRVTISSGTGGKLLAAYRHEVARTITNLNGRIEGNHIFGTENDVIDFSYDYTWGGNIGIVRVCSFSGTNSEIEIVTFCYEHQR